jgi:hypothetical protein
LANERAAFVVSEAGDVLGHSEEGVFAEAVWLILGNYSVHKTWLGESWLFKCELN